jgi:YHS domain-containing protein
MNIIKLAVAISILALHSCGSSSNTNSETAVATKTEEAPQKDFSKLQFSSDKDLVCGMKLTMGIEDTLTHEGKLYGFCNTGCKEAFVKNPTEFLAAK